MGDTSISWTDKTWNPIRGCSRISAGCMNCYAERVAHRFSGDGQPYAGLTTDKGRWNGVVRMVPEHLADPLHWRSPKRVFVNSMSDLFHESLTNEQIAAVFGVMAAAPRHTFQVLTKRAKRMADWFKWARGPFTEQQRGIVAAPNTPRAMLDAASEYLGTKHDGLNTAWRSVDHDPWPLPNVWLGVSVENQEAADERIPHLLAATAAVRFLSCEPLLGPLNLPLIRWGTLDGNGNAKGERAIDWCIAGCESGPGARSCNVEWLRSIRDQCKASGVPLFLKQAVFGAVFTAGPGNGHYGINIDAGSKRKAGSVIELPYLDGVQYAAFPEAR